MTGVEVLATVLVTVIAPIMGWTVNRTIKNSSDLAVHTEKVDTLLEVVREIRDHLKQKNGGIW